jgi:hypothetical protein
VIRKLLQFRVLRLGLPQDGDVRVGVFPECQKILICGAGFGGVTLQSIGSANLEMRQCADGRVQHNSRMVEDFLKLYRCLAALMSGEVRLSSNKNRIQAVPHIVAEGCPP